MQGLTPPPTPCPFLAVSAHPLTGPALLEGPVPEAGAGGMSQRALSWRGLSLMVISGYFLLLLLFCLHSQNPEWEIADPERGAGLPGLESQSGAKVEAKLWPRPFHAP